MEVDRDGAADDAVLQATQLVVVGDDLFLDGDPTGEGDCSLRTTESARLDAGEPVHASGVTDDLPYLVSRPVDARFFADRRHSRSLAARASSHGARARPRVQPRCARCAGRPRVRDDGPAV